MGSRGGLGRRQSPQPSHSLSWTVPRFHGSRGRGARFFLLGVVEKSGIGQNGNEGEIEVASVAS